MAEFITKCPHCSTDLQAQDEWIGMEVECPECQKTFIISTSSLQVEAANPESAINSALAADEKNCPFCGGVIKEQAVFCKHCKTDLNKTTAPQAQIQVESHFIFICPECDTAMELPESMKDKEYECPCCSESSIAQETIERSCPLCGEKVKIKATVCKHCKQKIKPIDTVNIPAESQQQMPSENFIFICPECNTVAELSESMKDKEYECPGCCESSIAQETLERDCPLCGEKVKIKATVCKHCKQKIKPIKALNTQKQWIKNLFSQKESSAVQPYTQASSTLPEPPVQETCGEGGSLSFCELLGSTWNILCCRPGVAIGFTALLGFIYLSIDICRFIISSLAQENNIAIGVISLIFLLPGIFIQPVFLLWIQLNALLLRRNQEINPQSIFLYVKQNQWMHFLWGFWRPTIFIFLWSLLLIVPGLIAGMKYIMTLFILLDNPELSVKEAMMHSAEITMGHKLKIFGALFVVVLISSGCTVLVQIITQSVNIATIVSWGISIILMPFTSLFFAGIYERIRRS